MTTAIRRILIIVGCVLLMPYVAPASAQTSVVVNVEVTTRASTADRLSLELRGSRDRPEVLDLGSEFTAGTTETRTFTIGKAHFCEFFSSHLSLIQLGSGFDDWSGTLNIRLNGDLVTNAATNLTTLDATPTSWWAGTGTYAAQCGDPATSSWGANLQRVDFRVTTGSDGTTAAPTLALSGNFSAGLLPIMPVVSGGFMPKTTITYTYYIPLERCQITGFGIHQWEHPWSIQGYSLVVDGVMLAKVTTPFTVAPDTPHHQLIMPPRCP